MKTKIIVSVAMFALAFVLEGAAERIFPFEEILKVMVKKA